MEFRRVLFRSQEARMPPFQTHTVVNQVAPLEDYSLYDTDIALNQAVSREGAAGAEAELREHGAWLGRAHILAAAGEANRRSEEHTSELQSLMRISYAVFCLKKTNNNDNKNPLQTK